MVGYFDLHSHILPGVDDGAASLEETRSMLQTAYEEGIRIMTATPHYAIGRKNASVKQLQELVEELNEPSFDLCNKPHIILGNELLFSKEIIDALNRGDALTIDGTRYILVEFFPEEEFGMMREGLHHCLLSGYIPILAHTERYHCLIRHPWLVGELIQMGVYVQINFSGLVGHILSPKVNFCHKLLKKDWVHFLGTDAHGAHNRAPRVRKEVTRLMKKYGEETVTRLLWSNPMKMLEDRHL